MPFHAEVSSPNHHARVFNLDEGELRANVIEPWMLGLPFEFGEQEWDPRESRLRILAGPTLDPPDLSFGQGWSNALRVSEDVTRAMLEAAEATAPDRGAATIVASSLEAAVERIGSGSDPEPIRWSSAVERINGRDPEIAAVILVLRPPPEDSR